MKLIILGLIIALIGGALAPSTLPYGITAFLNGICIVGACVLSYNLGRLF